MLINHLHFCNLVLSKPEFLQSCKSIEILNLLFHRVSPLSSVPPLSSSESLSNASKQTYSYPIRRQLEIAQLGKAFQFLNLVDLILYEVEILQFPQVVDALDMFDLVETQVKTLETVQVAEIVDVGDEVIV